MYRSLFKRATTPDFHIILYNNLPTKMMEKGLGVCASIYPKRNDTEKDRGHVVLKCFYMVLVLYEKHQDVNLHGFIRNSMVNYLWFYMVNYPPGISHLDLIPLKPPFSLGTFQPRQDVAWLPSGLRNGAGWSKRMVQVRPGGMMERAG
jgi:hypothetical protein